MNFVCHTLFLYFFVYVIYIWCVVSFIHRQFLHFLINYFIAISCANRCEFDCEIYLMCSLTSFDWLHKEIRLTFVINLKISFAQFYTCFLRHFRSFGLNRNDKLTLFFNGNQSITCGAKNLFYVLHNFVIALLMLKTYKIYIIISNLGRSVCGTLLDLCRFSGSRCEI